MQSTVSRGFDVPCDSLYRFLPPLRPPKGEAATSSRPHPPSFFPDPMIKHLLMLALVLPLLCQCQRPLPPVPQSHRPVVAPRGSTDVVKPWNGTTRQEGDAILGPLSNMRR